MAVTRTKNIYDPLAGEPFKLSRSKIENFMRCPRCFYLDRRLGVGQPSIPGYTLNSAVDTLLKKEFDTYRAAGKPHPFMIQTGLDALPYQHPELDSWRHNFTGVQFLHPATNFLLFGAVDDLWVLPSGELIVVDYKSTSKDGTVSLNDEWKDGYKRQMEIYQYLLRGRGFSVSNTGFFVYANGRTDLDAFSGRLEFKMSLLPYTGDDSWVDGTILRAHHILGLDTLPDYTPACEYCQYRQASAVFGA
jgi:RecB family exonuclease